MIDRHSHEREQTHQTVSRKLNNNEETKTLGNTLRKRKVKEVKYKTKKYTVSEETLRNRIAKARAFDIQL